MQKKIIDIGSILKNPFMQNVMSPQLIQLLTLIENSGDEAEFESAFQEIMDSLPESKQQKIMKIFKQMGLFEEE